MAAKRDKGGHFIASDPAKQLEVKQERTPTGQFTSTTKPGSRRAAMESELKLLVKHHNGIITPQDVLKQAERGDSALHDYFTWDDGEAAEKWRLTEARQLITAVKITIEDREIQVRALTSLDIDRHKGGGYRFLEDVVASPALREHLLQTALRELKSVEARYQHLEELDHIWGAIDGTSEQVSEADKSPDSDKSE